MEGFVSHLISYWKIILLMCPRELCVEEHLSLRDSVTNFPPVLKPTPSSEDVAKLNAVQSGAYKHHEVVQRSIRHAWIVVLTVV